MLLRQTEARKVLKPLRQLFKFKEGCPDMLWVSTCMHTCHASHCPPVCHVCTCDGRRECQALRGPWQIAEQAMYPLILPTNRRTSGTSHPGKHGRAGAMFKITAGAKQGDCEQTLSILWDDAIAVPSPSKTPGRDALIARSLIRLLTGLARPSSIARKRPVTNDICLKRCFPLHNTCDCDTCKQRQDTYKGGSIGCSVLANCDAVNVHAEMEEGQGQHAPGAGAAVQPGAGPPGSCGKG